MAVHTTSDGTHIATLEGRSMVEYTVAKNADETNQIDGNIYVGRIQNVLPGMELAFVDIGIPKNAVLYRGDVSFDTEDVEGVSSNSNAKRIEEMIRAGQTVICQVTKNAIGAKGARLTQEVSLPGRFSVLVPNSTTIGISKRLPDGERRRLRKIIDEVRPERHGIIVRTAAEGVSSEDLARDVYSLVEKWTAIEAEVAKSNQPRLVYRDLDLAVRVLREELNDDYRAVLIDDR
jgi:ribonuclease E